MNYDELRKRIDEHISGYIELKHEFSVLVPIVLRGDEMSLLYQLRGSKIKRQPGEISFPGGMKEEGETDADCAVRETCEELGIDMTEISSVSKVADHYTWLGYGIHIYTAFIEGTTIDECSPSAVEVEELFEVPLSWLMENEPIVYHAKALPSFEEEEASERVGYPDGYNWITLKNDEPAYYYKDYCIWGITGRITRYFVENILK